MKTCPECGEPNVQRARFCQACGRPLQAEAPVREVRKTVTILFADVAGSTGLAERLDAESLQQVMSRFFEAMAASLERHGGSVEKFIGDAVMAVFGVPSLHEDDALRAVRAAVEMRGELEKLNDELERTHMITLQIRTGINTGEVMVGSLKAGQTFVAGDTVNVAARLEQTAEPGEILLGEATFGLVRDVVAVEPRGRIRLRGKKEDVVGYRLLQVHAGDTRTARGMRSPIVGRASELTLLQQAFELSVSERSCYLFTVLGTPGVGKSRLIEEAIVRLEGHPVVLSGRCLPYGEGITFWPIRELVWQACDIPADAEPHTVREAIASRIEGQEHADRIVEGVAHLVGLAGASGTPEETSWGIRRFLEVTGRKGPLAVVIDDIHWAEPGFLDLIEYLADFAKIPMLLVCMARRELLDVRPSWGAGRRNAMTITLSPLTDVESRTLVDNLLGGGRVDDPTRTQIVEASEGNPFFIEEIVRMLLDDGTLRLEGGEWVASRDLQRLGVPATISALLAARLERLQEDERAVAERASVVGKVFYWGAVAALTPEAERLQVGRHLQALVRKDLITPDESPFSGEDAFRFRHILIRDEAYRAIPKERRADLHERLAGWIAEKVGNRLSEFEEIIGHHLEQAYRYRRELGQSDEETDLLAVRATQHLWSSGRRALERRDVPGAVNLLPRAAALLPRGHPARVSVLPDLAQALVDHGDLGPAAEVLAEAAQTASADPATAAHAELTRLWLQLYTEPEGKAEAIPREVERIMPTLERLGDERGLARASYLLVEIDWMACRYAAVERGLERVVASAARVGDRRQGMEAMGRLAAALVYGPVPAEEALSRCEDIRSRAGGDLRVEAGVLLAQAELSAMLGRFDGVRGTIDRAEAILEDTGLKLLAMASDEVRGAVEMLAGDPLAAERALGRTYRGLERLGERGMLSTTGAELAQAIYAQGRHDDAERFAAISDQTGASDDVATQLLVRGVRAKVAAHRGRLGEAETLARSGVDLAITTEAPGLRGDAYMDLAEVLRVAGRVDEAGRVLDQAAREFEAKGNVVSARRARATLAELATAARGGA